MILQSVAIVWINSNLWIKLSCLKAILQNLKMFSTTKVFSYTA